MARKRQPEEPVHAVDGGYAVRLGKEETALLERLLAELRQLLLAGPDQPVLRRMFPPAYHLTEDADAEAEFQRLMHEELVASRLSAIASVNEVLREPRTLDEGGLIAFMQAVNSLRLVLGTLLDVDETSDLDDLAEDDPMLAEHHLYGYLSYLLDLSVRVLGSPAS